MQRSRLCHQSRYTWYGRYLDLERLLNRYTDDNKTRIAKSGALMPLTRLARSKDMRVQRNATGALLNMTHSGALSRPHRVRD